MLFYYSTLLLPSLEKERKLHVMLTLFFGITLVKRDAFGCVTCMHSNKTANVVAVVVVVEQKRKKYRSNRSINRWFYGLFVQFFTTNEHNTWMWKLFTLYACLCNNVVVVVVVAVVGIIAVPVNEWYIQNTTVQPVLKSILPVIKQTNKQTNELTIQGVIKLITTTR